MTVSVPRRIVVPTPARSVPRAALRPLPATMARWLLRAAFALQYVTVALLTVGAATTPQLAATGNYATPDRAPVALDGGVVQAIGQLYPLLSGVLLRFLPFGVHGAAVLGRLAAGVFLQVLAAGKPHVASATVVFKWCSSTVVQSIGPEQHLRRRPEGRTGGCR